MLIDGTFKKLVEDHDQNVAGGGRGLPAPLLRGTIGFLP